MQLTRPEVGVEELEAVGSVLKSSFLTQGPVAEMFETAVARYTGTAFAVATSSCTTALHLALGVLGVEPGQEVIVPDFTFPATANAVIQQGAVPVLVDVDPDTLTMSTGAIRDAITDRTAAIMPVHTFGLCADMDEIVHVAGDIPVIEDAACALGSTYKDRMAGGLGAMAAFSFHPRKVITTGEGGMLVTNREDLWAQAKLLASHGGRRSNLFLEFTEAGFNYRLSDIQSAIGVVQMNKIDRIIQFRRQVAAEYFERLRHVEGLELPLVPTDRSTTFQSFVVRLHPTIDRDLVVKGMRAQGIEVTLGTYALHCQPYFQETFGYQPGDMPDSYRAYSSTLTLPLWPTMQVREVEEVCSALQSLLRG